MEDFRLVWATGVVRDEGTLVVFCGYDYDANEEVTFAAEHRLAQAILDAIEECGDAACEVPDHMVLSAVSA